MVNVPTTYKARLVAQGFSQVQGEDYDQIFSPVISFDSIRAIICLAAKHNWSIHQMDVKTAFLNGDLNEDVYVKQPTGFVVPGKENLACHLNKALYGLKQSPKCWNDSLSNAFKELGFIESVGDPCIFVKTDS